MATLTVQDVDLDGLSAPVYSAADVAGDTFANDGKTFLHFKNTNASARNVTINAVGTCNFGFDHDQVINVPATTGDVMVGPFSAGRFNTSTGFVTMTYDAVPGLTVAVLSV